MSEHLENDHSPSSDAQEADIVAILKKIQQQLNYLEKKIDSLAEGRQPSGERAFDRPSFKEKHFSKPYRSFNTRTEHYGRQDQDRGHGGNRPERGGYGQGRPSFGGRPRRDDHRGGPGGGFGGPKKPFYRGRKDRD